MSFKHFLRTGKFEHNDENEQFETTVIDEGHVAVASTSSGLINEPIPLEEDNKPKTYHKLFQKHSATVTIELTAEDLQRPQEAVASHYGINKIIFSKMWKNSAGRGVRWPYRRLAVIRSQINNLSKTQRSEQANQEQIQKLHADYLKLLASHTRKLHLHQSYFENRRTRRETMPLPLEDNMITLLQQQQQQQQQFQLWSPGKQQSNEISNQLPITDTFEDAH